MAIRAPSPAGRRCPARFTRRQAGSFPDCATFVNGADVLTWFDLHTKVTDDPLPVANRTHVKDGKITAIRVTFDPWPLTAGSSG